MVIVPGVGSWVGDGLADLLFEVWAEELPGVVCVVVVGVVVVVGRAGIIRHDFEGGFFGCEEGGHGWGKIGWGGGGPGKFGFFAGDCGNDLRVIDFDLRIEEFDGDSSVLAGPFEVE